MKKVKKIIGWIVLAIIVGGVLSVPIIEHGWTNGMLMLGGIAALFIIVFWAMDAITGE